MDNVCFHHDRIKIKKAYLYNMELRLSDSTIYNSFPEYNNGSCRKLLSS